MEKYRSLKNQLQWELTTLEILWLRENNHKYTDKELAAKFHCSYARIRHFKDKYNIKKQVQKKWTEEDVEFLKANYGRMGDKAIAKKLKRNIKGIATKRRYLQLKRTPEQLFFIRRKNGIAAQKMVKKVSERYHNEGEKWFQESSQRWLIRINGKAVGWHRWRYEQLHGSIPPGHMVVFADGNKLNTADENLVLLKRKRGMDPFRTYITSIHCRQRKVGHNHYLAKGATVLMTPFGGVWYIERYQWCRKMKERIDAFLENYNPHDNSDNPAPSSGSLLLPATTEQIQQISSAD